ncbi:MAG: putative quinol monooxygenase [Pseudomonadota bacterium]
MIVVTGVIEVDAEHVWPATTAAAKMVAETEKEDGCITYRFYVDISNTSMFRVYEEWRDDDALAAHFRTPHMAEFQNALKGFRILRRELVKFEVTETQAL